MKYSYNYRYIFPCLLILILFFTLETCKDQPNKVIKNISNQKTIKKSTQKSINQKNNKIISIVFLGDSLTEGYGLDKIDSYPSQTEIKLNLQLSKEKQNFTVKAVNGGLSGDTTIGGLNRLMWFLKDKPDYLFLALGSNDGLRGIDLKTTKNNLNEIIKLAQSLKIKILLAGLELPLNYGEKYRAKFRRIYSSLAHNHKLSFLPFLLENVAGEESLNLGDGIHPNKKGYNIISDQVSAFIYQNIVKGKK